MTLVEFFDKNQLDNIINCITLMPQKIIFIGCGVKMNLPIERYKKYLKAKNIQTQIEKIHIRKDDAEKAVSVLKSIIEKEPECIFDISGGNELFICILGMLKSEMKETRKFTIRQIDSLNNKIFDFSEKGRKITTPKYNIGIKDLVFLFGGAVKSIQNTEKVLPNGDIIEKIWNISKENSKQWNENIQIFKEFEKHLSLCNNKLSRLSSSVNDCKLKFQKYTSFLKTLESNNLIRIKDSSPDSFFVEYSDDFVKTCLDKAGNALELKVCLELIKLKKNSYSYFDEVSWSVTIDWDGVIPDIRSRVPNTVNEIDVIATKGIHPLFISCKNGSIDEAELYKLNSVASRFGGSRVKKLLIASNLSKESFLSRESFLQRADEMGISIVPNANKLSEKEWESIFLM